MHEKPNPNSKEIRDLKLRVSWQLMNSELFDQIDFPGKPSKDLINEIAIREDQNLGTNVAEVITKEMRGLVDQLGNLTGVNLFGHLRLAVILGHYARVARDYLIAQEVVRTGEVPQYVLGDDVVELGKSRSFVQNILQSLKDRELADGKSASVDKRENAEIVEDVSKGLFYRQLEFVLRRSDDPIEFVDRVTDYYLQIPYPPEEKGEGPRVIRALEDTFIRMGRDRFHDLYNAAMRVRGKELGMSPEELHRDWWQQQKRKGRRLT